MFFSSRISKSDVLKTLANNDKKETDTRQIKVDKHVAQKSKKQLPKVSIIIQFPLNHFGESFKGNCIPNITQATYK